MKLLMTVISVLFAAQAVADHRDLVHQARRVTRLIEDAGEIPEKDGTEISSLLDQIEGVLAHGGKGDLVCLESTQQPGKGCIKALAGDNSCLGNYFSTVALCRSSLRVARKGIACYESKDFAGKALLAKIDVNIERIGNYYSSLENCTTAMAAAKGNLVCVESEAQAGKWFIGDLLNKAEKVGPYFNNRKECLDTITNRH